MTAKTGNKFRKILACGLTAAVILSSSLPFFADGADNDAGVIYNDSGSEGENPNFFDYTSLITKTFGDRGYIDVDSGNLVVNLDGTKTDIRLFGMRYDIASEGIPTGDKLNTLIGDMTSHGYNLIVVDDVYSVLKSSSNFSAFSEFLYGLYQANMYAGIGLFSTSSLVVNKNSKGAALLDTETVRRAQSFIKRFFATKNNYRSDENITVNYADDTTIAFVTYCSDLDVGADSVCYSALRSDFNEWLLEEYGSTDALSVQWVNSSGESVLGENENAKRGTVAVPTEPVNYVYNEENTGRSREVDFGRFLLTYCQTQYNTLEKLIRNCGYRSPVILSDNDSTAFSTCISGLGNATRGDFDFTADMTVKQGIAAAALGTVADKPYMTIWNASSGTENMKSSAFISKFVSLVSYACYQDWDALVIGNYSFTDTTSVNNNETLWENSGFMATLFRHNAVVAAYDSSFGIAYSSYDTVMDFGRFKNSALSSALIAKTENVFFDTEYTADSHFKVVMSAGNTSTGSYVGANSSKETGTKAVIQALYPYQNGSFFRDYMNKKDWYNDQGLVSTRDRTIENIEGIDIYFGEGKAIIPDGVIESSSQLATTLDRLGFTSYRNANDSTDIGCYSSSGLLVTENGRIYYNEDTDTVVAFGTRYFMASGELSEDMLNSVYDAYIDRYYYDSTTEKEYQNIKVSISNVSGNGTVVVYALGSGTNNETAERFVVYTCGEDDTPLTADLKIIRENTEYKAYGINRDGFVGNKGAVMNTDNTVSDSSGNMLMSLNGEYDYYIVNLAETDLDASLVDYNPQDSIPEKQSLFWYIIIPAIFFLIVVYSAILISDNLKIKREERLRVATRKVTLGKTRKYASALDVADDDLNRGRTKGTPGADIFEEDEEERRRRENPWERDDGTIDFTKIVRSDDEDENAW